MTSRERVYAALERKPTDRVPVFMWFDPATQQRLSQLLEVPPFDVPEAMGDDIRQAWVNNNHEMAGVVQARDGDRRTDPWGIQWTREGGMNQISRSPLTGAAAARIAAYRMPLDHADSLVSAMEAVTGYGGNQFVGCDVSPCAFEMYWRLRGMEEANLDLIDEPEAAGTLLRRCGQFARLLAERACERYPLDWLWTGDDVGGQQGMLMGLEMWRELIKPCLQEVFSVAANRELWLAFHSCGAIRPIIPDLIEMGVDVLNPIQGNCPGMDPIGLKEEFGDKLSFMGGVDTQELLPRGSAADVRRETERLSPQKHQGKES